MKPIVSTGKEPLILKLERQSHVPVYLQIADQLKELISKGVLKIGDQLPATRDLATSLGVHRTTVTNAYAELESEGIIDGHVGRGTFIAATPRSGRTKLSHDESSFSPLFWNALFVNEATEDRLHRFLHLTFSKDVISFAYALPSPDLFPLDDIKSSFNRVLRREGRVVLQLGEGVGYLPLREYLLGKLAMAGMRVTPDEILITNGCQHALDLIRRVLVSPGDTVVLENPTYPGAFRVFDSKEYKCISIPVTDNGLDLAALEDVLSHQRAKLIYLVPTFHNPTGITMDIMARRRLLDLALKHRVPIVEDNIYGELRYEGSSVPSLKALDEKGVVIYIDSFSKMGFPGLRVGWIAAPSILIHRLTMTRQSSDLHTNLVAQAVIAGLSKHGLLAKHLKRVRHAYAERRDRMLKALEDHFPEETRWNHPQGGMCLWVILPARLDAEDILSQAIQDKVIFSPGANFYLNAPQLNTMRLTFTTVDVTKIEEGVKRLGAILKKQLRQTRARSAHVEPKARPALV